MLAVPMIVAANPVDATWQVGWYDDGDTDRLVTQTMSPESMAGLAVLVLVCLSAHARLIIRIRRKHSVHSSREPVPRGPPWTVTMIQSRFVAVSNVHHHSTSARQLQPRRIIIEKIRSTRRGLRWASTP
jgi:hypothetical protein